MSHSHSLKSLGETHIGDYIGDYHRGYSGEYYEFRLWLICESFF